MKSQKFISIMMVAAFLVSGTTPGWASQFPELTDPAAALTPVRPATDNIAGQPTQISKDSFQFSYDTSPLSPTTPSVQDASITPSAPVSFTVDKTTSGAGTLKLSGANTYTGATAISSSTLNISSGLAGTLHISNADLIAFPSKTISPSTLNISSGNITAVGISTGSYIQSGSTLNIISSENAGTLQLSNADLIAFPSETISASTLNLSVSSDNITAVGINTGSYIPSSSTVNIVSSETAGTLQVSNGSLIAFPSETISASTLNLSSGNITAAGINTGSFIQSSSAFGIINSGNINITPGYTGTIINAGSTPISLGGTVTFPEALVLSPTSSLTILDGTLSIIDTGFPVGLTNTGTSTTMTATSTLTPNEGMIVASGSIPIIPESSAEITLIGNQKAPGAAVIADHMKKIAKLLQARPQIETGPQDRKAVQKTNQELRALERSVNKTVRETRKTDKASSQVIAKTWKDFQKNILRPAVIEDAKKGGNSSKVFAYEQGSLLFGKLLKSKL